jgi:valyl-tRNA synthetase
VRIPFVERDVPIVADAVVDRAFGTGAVKITPGHDHDDYQTGLRHGLPAPTILAEDATVAETGTRYDGMDRYEARLAIVADLEGRGDLAAQRPHEMVIGRCQRSGDVVEPRIKTQWFVRTGPLAARALEATRSGRTRILPERFEKTWEHWLTNIRDWNVSRQLWWGHRIPAWYCPDGHVTVTSAETGPDACAVCGRPARELQQDPDIFDTWFSAGLWPWSTLGWPDDTPDLATFYPTSVMETGYDIIFFWVARMMMLGLELTGQEPFHTVYLSGLIRDPDGRKMSKTKGNVVDPLGVIDDAGADALRFAVIHGATPGNDQRFSDAKLEHARNFANKLWNATRYVTGARPSSIPEGAERRLPDVRHLGPAERWLLSRAAATTAAVDAAMAGYAFGEVTRLLYEAIWSEYCDWGLELAKVRLSDERLGADEREATWWTLVDVLDTYLRLLHPVMPFVTEALWGALAHRAGDPDLLIVARWPGVGERDADAEREVGTLIDLVTEIRNARASAKLPASDWLEALVYVPTSLGDTFEALRPAVERLARMRPLHRELTPEALASASRPGDLMVILGGGEIEAAVRPRATDDEAAELERDRLERDLEEAEGWLAAARERLANESFVSRAPASVVEGARAREAELADQVARLRDRTGR